MNYLGNGEYHESHVQSPSRVCSQKVVKSSRSGSFAVVEAVAMHLGRSVPPFINQSDTNLECSLHRLRSRALGASLSFLLVRSLREFQTPSKKLCFWQETQTAPKQGPSSSCRRDVESSEVPVLRLPHRAISRLAQYGEYLKLSTGAFETEPAAREQTLDGRADQNCCTEQYRMFREMARAFPRLRAGSS